MPTKGPSGGPRRASGLQLSEVEAPLVLDEEFADHLAIAESIRYLWQEKFSGDLFLPDEDFAAQMWRFVVEYVQSYSTFPDRAVMDEEYPQFEFQAARHPIEYLVRKFRERYASNEIKTALKKVARALGEDPLAARSLGFQEFHRITSKTASNSIWISSHDWQRHLEEYKENVLNGRLAGITLGWADVNDVLCGLRKGGLYYIVGRPKRYKSWMLLQSAVEAQRAGHKAVFFSLELPKEEIFARYQCLAADVSWSRYQHNQLTSEDYARIKYAMERLSEESLPLEIARPDVGTRTVPQLIELAKEHEAEIVYIDQMSFIESHRAPNAAPLWERIKYQCEDLKNGCVRADVPLYIANQFNRLADNPTLAEMGTLDMIAGGDAIGQYADMLLGLYQSKDLRQSNILEYGTIDSRSFESARWRLAVNLSRECNFRVIERVVD